MEKFSLCAALVLQKKLSNTVIDQLYQQIKDEEYSLFQYETFEEFNEWAQNTDGHICLITDFPFSCPEIFDYMESYAEAEFIFICHEDEVTPGSNKFPVARYDDKNIMNLPVLLKARLDVLYNKLQNEFEDQNTYDGPEEADFEDGNETPLNLNEKEIKDLQDAAIKEQEEFIEENLSEPIEDDENPQGEDNSGSAVDKGKASVQQGSPGVGNPPPEEGSGPNENKTLLPPPDSSKRKEEALELPPTDKSQIAAKVATDKTYINRSRYIQKKMMDIPSLEGSKVIGVWSPLHRMGVTSFVVNFGLYLADHKIETTVLEGISPNYILKDLLFRYTERPKNWVSYAKALQKDEISGQVHWNYKNVRFLPIDKDDYKLDWNKESLRSYMDTRRVGDITLVDLPTGKMALYTEEVLQYMDELWILIDDCIQELSSWDKYIKEMKTKFNINIYLIANKTMPFSKPELISEKFKEEILAKIPSMHEQTMKSYYLEKPLYAQNEAQAKLQEYYHPLAKHLLDSSFTPKQPKRPIIARLKYFMKS